MQDDAHAPEPLIIGNYEHTTSFDNRQSLPPPVPPAALPGSLGPGSVVIPNKEVDPTIDTFIAEVRDLKKEGEMTSSSSTAQGEVKVAKNNAQPQPMTAELIKEMLRTGEIRRSEIL